MKKITLRLDELAVETFETAAAARAAEPGRGTVRARDGEGTLVRSCQTEQYNCTAQGGYTCDYGSCVYTWCNCETSEETCAFPLTNCCD